MEPLPGAQVTWPSLIGGALGVSDRIIVKTNGLPFAAALFACEKTYGKEREGDGSSSKTGDGLVPTWPSGQKGMSK